MKTFISPLCFTLLATIATMPALYPSQASNTCVTSSTDSSSLTTSICSTSLQEITPKDTAHVPTATQVAQEILGNLLYNIGKKYYANPNKKENAPKAVAFYQAANNQRNAKAQCALAGLYLKGEGVAQDVKKALDLYEQAAAQGNPIAQYILAVHYQKGIHVQKNVKKALELYQRSAEQECALAQCALGDLYATDSGVEKNFKKAVEYYQLAAAQNNANAQFKLGIVYYPNGIGTRKNLLKAIKYVLKAADNGNMAAQVTACHVLRKGILIQKNEKLADEYFKRLRKTVLEDAKQKINAKDISEEEKQKLLHEAETTNEQQSRNSLDQYPAYTQFIQASIPIGCAGDECPICNGERPPFEQDDWVSILPCWHIFCQDCIKTWFAAQRTAGRQLTCPTCRAIVQQGQIITGTVL